MAIIGSLPVTLTNGTIADATQVMADFNYILTQVNANAAPITGGTYLPLTSGTLKAATNTNLVIDKSGSGFVSQLIGSSNGSVRWDVVLGNSTAESTGNIGSDFQIIRFDDTGNTIDVPLTIMRSSGVVTVGGSQPTLTLTGAAGTNRLLQWFSGAATRWQLYCTNTAETGGSAGSDMIMYTFSDTAVANIVYSITRSTQVVNFAKAIVNGPSDRTLKENIAPLEGSLDKVRQLQGVGFNFKATPDKREIGLIAQDVAPVVPEIVQSYQSGEGESQRLLALDYPKLVALLIESVKTLTSRIEALEAKLAT